MKTVAFTCRHAQHLYGIRRARLFDLTDRGVISAVSSETNRKSYRPEAITAAVAYADLRRRGVSRAVATAIAKTINDLSNIVSAVDYERKSLLSALYLDNRKTASRSRCQRRTRSAQRRRSWHRH